MQLGVYELEYLREFKHQYFLHIDFVLRFSNRKLREVDSNFRILFILKIVNAQNLIGRAFHVVEQCWFRNGGLYLYLARPSEQVKQLRPVL